MLNVLVFCLVLCIFALFVCVLFDLSPMDYHSWFPLVLLRAVLLICSVFCVVLCMFVCLRTMYFVFVFVFVQFIVYVCLSSYCVLCMCFVFVLCIVYVCLSSYCVLYMFICLRTMHCVPNVPLPDSPILYWVTVEHHCSFLYCVFYFILFFACLRTVYCVFNGLPIPDSPCF
jgi:hypothetical protein